MQKDKEQGGETAHSLHGSCSSREKLDIEQQDLWRFFWSLLGNFQYFLQLEQPMCLQNPSWFSLCFCGSMGWTLQLLLLGTQFELWWAMNCLERGWCLSVPFHQLQSTALVLQNRLDEQNVSSWDCFLNTKEGKQKYCWKKNSQKNSEETVIASVPYTQKARFKLNVLSDFLLKRCHRSESPYSCFSADSALLFQGCQWVYTLTVTPTQTRETKFQGKSLRNLLLKFLHTSSHHYQGCLQWGEPLKLKSHYRPRLPRL